MVAEVLRYDPPLDARDRQFSGTALDWLIHGAQNPWGFSSGQHAKCARLLLGAGVRFDETSLPTGNDAVDRVLRERFVSATG
jgi:hypothetical protein